ncbi:hypothetical protein NDU88_007220 [Pleurodeles waltl]|uniref:Uncharacterized protein n=1 Tax=Pleurodeles waltl TaxID=8319 RepID=A0AAV7UNZ2_PLEWA|nr:hypothetical protein NDU88_007220 [Pleurodeles waltl]
MVIVMGPQAGGVGRLALGVGVHRGNGDAQPYCQSPPRFGHTPEHGVTPHQPTTTLHASPLLTKPHPLTRTTKAPFPHNTSTLLPHSPLYAWGLGPPRVPRDSGPAGPLPGFGVPPSWLNWLACHYRRDVSLMCLALLWAGGGSTDLDGSLRPPHLHPQEKSLSPALAATSCCPGLPWPGVGTSAADTPAAVPLGFRATDGVSGGQTRWDATPPPSFSFRFSFCFLLNLMGSAALLSLEATASAPA